MDGMYVGASRAVLQSIIAGIAGGCASLHPKIASSLGNCCSVGVTTAAGRVAGGVFIFAPSLGAPHATDQRHKLGSENFELHEPRTVNKSTLPPASRDRLSAPGTASRGANRTAWARFDCSQIFDCATAARFQTCFPIRNDG